jgi:CTP synthase (UTP-ammonia lyase)
MKVRIGIIGDYRDDFAPHSTTNDFLAHAAAVSGAEVASSWLETDRVTDKALQQFDALWIAPGSPYQSLEGALAAVSPAKAACRSEERARASSM